MIKRALARTFAGLAFLFSQLVFALPSQAANDVDYLSFATDDEANTTEVFSNASPSVVYVTSTALRRQMFSLNVMEIPQGAGSGFVWDEGGKIIGNASLIPFRHKGKRIYLIANVATHPDHRRRGIARAMTQKTMELARKRGSHELWLHVRDDNPAAIQMYRNMGYEIRAHRTTWAYVVLLSARATLPLFARIVGP